MRLLFLTETHPPDRGGMSESCDRILRGLAREGVQLDVVHFDRRASRFDQRATSSGSILRVPPEADAAHLMNLVWNRIGERAQGAGRGAQEIGARLSSCALPPA